MTEVDEFLQADVAEQLADFDRRLKAWRRLPTSPITTLDRWEPYAAEWSDLTLAQVKRVDRRRAGLPVVDPRDTVTDF